MVESKQETGINYEEWILARMGEIALKGLNRHRFEQRLMLQIRRKLSSLGRFEIHQRDSRIWICPEEERSRQALDQALVEVCKVFGLVSASPVQRYPYTEDLTQLQHYARHYVRTRLGRDYQGSFKVEARRGDKHYPHPSPVLARELGAAVLSYCKNLHVDVHEPDFTLRVEVRDAVYLYHSSQPGTRGLPLGSSGKGMLLLSGGIDSPVAGYMMASRGMALEAIYFHAFPYTSDKAKEKVIQLAEILTDYCGGIRLHVVDFTETQLALRELCPPDMMTIVMRRMMMREAEAWAEKRRCQALITGESLGQVASQTAEGLVCSNAVVSKPVFRPLIGVDKDETVRLARQIGSFETSILPYEDCCTVFVPRHPRTRPSLRMAEEAERKLDIEALVSRDLQKIETLILPREEEEVAPYEL